MSLSRTIYPLLIGSTQEIRAISTLVQAYKQEGFKLIFQNFIGRIMQKIGKLVYPLYDTAHFYMDLDITQSC